MSSRFFVLFVGFLTASFVFRLILLIYTLPAAFCVSRSQATISFKSIKRADIFSEISKKVKKTNAGHILGGVNFFFNILLWYFFDEFYRKRRYAGWRFITNY